MEEKNISFTLFFLFSYIRDIIYKIETKNSRFKQVYLILISFFFQSIVSFRFYNKRKRKMDQVPSTQYNVADVNQQQPAATKTKKGLCDEDDCCLFG